MEKLKCANAEIDFVGFLALINRKLMRPFEEMFKGELTNLQFLTLCALCEGGPMPVTALAERLYVPKQQMTKIIAGLSEKGYVHRHSFEEDRRIVLVSVAEEYARMIAERRSEFIAYVSELISNYDGELERAHFLNYINELTRILSTLPD